MTNEQEPAPIPLSEHAPQPQAADLPPIIGADALKGDVAPALSGIREDIRTSVRAREIDTSLINYSLPSEQKPVGLWGRIFGSKKDSGPRAVPVEQRTSPERIIRAIDAATAATLKDSYSVISGGHSGELEFIASHLVGDLVERGKQDGEQRTIIRVNAASTQLDSDVALVDNIFAQLGVERKGDRLPPWRQLEIALLEKLAKGKYVLVLENAQAIPVEARGTIARSLRGYHNSRTGQPAWENFTAVISTTGTKGGLTPNDNLTPYNIGEDISLDKPES